MQHTHHFTIGELTLAALSNTAHIDQPVLCLHGWLDNAASFMPLAEQLPQLPLLALEFPGHGHSSHRSAGANYYFFDWVQDLVALCRMQHWQGLTVIGHSMGAMVATALAASFPELVSRIVLIDSLGFVTDSAEHTATQLRQGINSRLKPASRQPLYPTLQDAAIARQKQSDFSLHEAFLLAERGTIQSEQGLGWRADMRLRHSSVYRMTVEQANALCAGVSCPALSLLATDSHFYHDVKDYARHYPQLTMHTLTGGHHCHMTQPQQVAQFIRDFLQI